MNIIDTIKEFENVGYTRKQAEQQVKVMVDLKENLATKNDLQNVRDDIKNLITALNARFDLIDKRFDLLDKRIDFMPFKTTIYIAGVLLLFMGLSKYLPEFKNWVLFLLKN